MSQNGWDGRARVIVIEPELEIWVWSDSPKVDECLGWAKRQPGLRAWLVERGLLEEGANKPSDPKSAVEAALREVRQPQSAVIYRQLAETVSLERCSDASFKRLKSSLRGWFSV